MITTVIFDIGRVLARFEWEEFLESFGFPRETNAVIGRVMFTSPKWNEVDLGNLTDEEVLENFIQDAPQYRAEITQVFRQYPTAITLFPYVMDWVRSIKAKGKKVYYLSNYGESTKKRTIRELPFLDEMDGGLMSYQIHRVKPDPVFYRELFKRYDIVPGDAVFIDDNSANVEAARKLGLHAILFTSYHEVCRVLKEQYGI